MDHKSTGLEFSGDDFVLEGFQKARPTKHLTITGLAIAAGVALLGFLVYKVAIQGPAPSATAENQTLIQIDQRLTSIENRLEKVENDRKFGSGERTTESSNGAAHAQPPAHPAYHVAFSSPQPPGPGAQTDPATQERLAGIQQKLGALQNDTTSNHESSQAASDRLADVTGQLGAQHAQILHGQEALNQLLAQAERTAIPFEILRGSTPQRIGPVTIALKMSNLKSQHYTVCVYVQETCIELKDRTAYEVVQFVASHDIAPLQLIATKVTRDRIVGYLEVPR